MKYNGATIRDLMQVLRTKTSVQVLEDAASQQEAGHVFESICYGMIALGCSPFGPVKMMDGNINQKCGIVPYSSMKEVFDRKVKQGGGTGYSDITFQTMDEVLHVTTCKWIRNESSLEDYDIAQLKVAVHVHGLYSQYKNVQFVLACKDRTVFERVFQASHTKQDMLGVHHVMDVGTLEYFLPMVRDMMEKSGGLDVMIQNSYQRTPMKLLFHQELTLRKSLDVQGDPILWGLKCRSGKSYLMAGWIDLRMRVNPNASFLIITPMPQETMDQLRQTFERHTEFATMHIIQLSSKTVSYISKDQPSIIIASKQFLQNKSITALEDCFLDTTFFDETHEGGTTELSREMLNRYGKHQRIFLTATYRKPEALWSIPKERMFFWDLTDEELCKENAIHELKERHGSYVDEVIPRHCLPEEYQYCPKLKFFSMFLDPSVVHEIQNTRGMGTYGMDMQDLFAVENQRFMYEDRIHMMVRLILNTKGRSVMTRLSEMKIQPRSQLWFLPFGSEKTRIDEVSEAMENFLMKFYGQQYHIVNLGKCKDSLSTFITMHENIATVEKKRGVIFLSGNRGSTGITLPNVDLVILLNQEKEVDRIFQRMFRCMTERKDGSKKYGVVVDFNPSRVIRAVLSYGTMQQGTNVREQLTKLCRVIDFEDMLHPQSCDTIIDQMVQLWTKDVCSQYDFMQDQLSNVQWDEKVDWSLWRPYLKQLLQGTRKQKQLDFQKAMIAKEPVDVFASRREEEKQIAPKDTVSICMVLQKEFIPCFVHLISLCTVDHPSTEIHTLLKWCENDSFIYTIVLQQLLRWWDVDATEMYQLAKRMFTSMKDLTPITNSIFMIKEMLIASIDNKKELLDFLNSILKPKHSEKKKYGEVFTPLTLVEQMLDKLPSHVWSDPSLTWLDPCVGSGNFMVCVYYRLMEGLKDCMPDESKRKEHILSQMLYMVELNPKNVYVCQKIFGPLINIHEGDALTFDPYGESFGLKQFDIVIGNPPYNDGSGNKGKGHTLWTKFVEKTLQEWCKQGGYVCMVHPSLWRQHGHEMFELLRSRQIDYVEIHHEKDGMKTFQCNTRYDWYVLQNVDITNTTYVRDQDGKEHQIDLREWTFLPNSMFREIHELLVKDNEKSSYIIHDRSNYGTDKTHISKTKQGIYIHPVVYSINREDKPTFFWSSRNDRGHYGVAKVIYGGGVGFISDDGTYAMTEWCKGIVCPVHEHDRVIRTLKSKVFQQLISALSVSVSEINTKILKRFKDKWWEHPMFH